MVKMIRIARFFLFPLLLIGCTSCSLLQSLPESKLSALVVREKGTPQHELSIHLASIKLWNIAISENDNLPDNNGLNYSHPVITLELRNNTSECVSVGYDYTINWNGPCEVTMCNAYTKDIIPRVAYLFGGNCQQKIEKIKAKSTFQLKHLAALRKIEDLDTPITIEIKGELLVNGEKCEYTLSDTIIPRYHFLTR